MQVEHSREIETGARPTAAASGARVAVQAKLTVGAVDDPLEAEADAVADRVMRMPEPPLVQRACAKCEGEETRVQRKFVADTIRRFADTKQATQSASAETGDYITATRGGGSPLSTSTRSFMETRFGRDFGDVRVHHDADASRTARSLSARAFTVGADVYFGAGEYAPETAEGRKLLAHELTHTIQQGGKDAVRPKVQRFLSTEPAAGCGLCYGLPKFAGIAAHSLIQTEFEIAYPLGLVELPVSSPTDDNGRLDLAIATPTGLEIGEIKPATEDGYARGITDIAFYVGILKAMFPKISIRPLTRPLPPIVFPTLSPNCPTQALFVNPPVGGVYGYWCRPGFSELLSRGCNCKTPEREREPERVPERVPERRRVPLEVPVKRSAWREIGEWARKVYEKGGSATEAAEAFLRAHPELVWTVIGAGAGAIVALIADDATIAGIADDVLVPIIGALEWVALRMAFAG